MVHARKKKMAICKGCGLMKDMTYPALSRRDNRTYICSECGTREAMEDFSEQLKKKGK